MKYSSVVVGGNRKKYICFPNIKVDVLALGMPCF